MRLEPKLSTVVALDDEGILVLERSANLFWYDSWILQMPRSLQKVSILSCKSSSLACASLFL
eukprot:8098245-Prorocentrum_lima.AAC.1